MAASSASKGRPRSFTPKRGPATAASIPSRLRPAWSQAAPKEACWVSCPASWARCRPFVLVDVREPHEYQICRIPGSKLIPLGDVPKRMHELNSADEIVVHCRSGQRSAQAVELLMKAGFRKIHNLRGGVLAWADQVDPTMPKY